MKYLKKFNESNKLFATDKETIERWLRAMCPNGMSSNGGLLERIRIHPDGTIDVHGDIYILCKAALYDGKSLPIKFGVVSGSFDMDASGYTSLEGCPRECENFTIEFYEEEGPENLVGGPERVMGDYWVDHLPIDNLMGGPKYVGGKFSCSGTQITSLDGSPEEVGGVLDLDSTNLTDLKGAPRRVGSLSLCLVPYLTSLEGIPREIGYLLNITPSLEQSLERTLWDPRPMVDCEVGLIYISTRCRMYELLELFNPYETSYAQIFYDDPEMCKSITKSFIESLVYNYVRGDFHNPQINLFRLNEAFSEFGLDGPEATRAREMRFGGFMDNYELVDNEGRSVNFSGDLI